MNQADIKNSIMGSLFGPAIGDALGAPFEFEEPGSFPPITGFQSGGHIFENFIRESIN